VQAGLRASSLERGAQLISFDYSSAVDACAENNGHFPNVTLLQCDTFDMPFRKAVSTMSSAESEGSLQGACVAGQARRAAVHRCLSQGRFDTAVEIEIQLAATDDADEAGDVACVSGMVHSEVATDRHRHQANSEARQLSGFGHFRAGIISGPT